jgi:hypothetical protein
MDFFNEYALLIAIATPVIAIVAVQVALFVAGERDTLLLPGFGGYPSVPLAKRNAIVVTFEPKARPAQPSNEPMEREAA